MKNAKLIVLVLMICLLLTACGKPAENDDGHTADEENAVNPIESVVLDYQNAIHNNASFFYDNGWIYGQAGGPDGRSYFLKVREDGSEATNLGQFAILDPFLIDNYIYFMGLSDDGDGMYRMRTSGENLEKLSDAVGTMQFHDGYIYYTNSAFIDVDEITDDVCHLYRCDLDGKNVTEIIQRAVYYPFVFDDFILYQADRDNSSLHVCGLNGDNDRKLNDSLSYWPLYDGEYIYYVKEEALLDELSRTIWKMRIDGTEDQQVAKYQVSSGMLLTDEYIYFVYADDSDRLYRIKKDGSDITQITQDTNLVYIQFLGSGLKYTKLDDAQELIEGNYICDIDGSGKQLFYPD